MDDKNDGMLQVLARFATLCTAHASFADMTLDEYPEVEARLREYYSQPHYVAPVWLRERWGLIEAEPTDGP